MSDKGFEENVKGSMDKVKGKAKEEYGEMTDDASKEIEGKKDQVKGEAKKKYGDMKDKFSDDDEK
ncbi:CsbD family protein [Allobacillus sp. GCM10007491]|uniref:CsbD family protein n=1 Tax=Allobacillus saliphilus TaxID=2912308 RepID=A0A941HTZ3_9BACI|nr:CsbD family protein [Allobacillus saliphilus]MBR7554422.1 CsbD family protein [Allobacillus saliphilus]